MTAKNFKLNYNSISNSLKKNGYFIIKDYFDKKSLKEIKNSLLETLNYVHKSKQVNLQKKYYEVKKIKPKLKGHWYNIAPHNIDLLQKLHNPELLKFVKKFFTSKVIFSGRPAIHVHDDDNDKILDPHQETSQMARDTIVFWSPLYDTNYQTGGMSVFKNSHLNGYYKHTLEHPRLGRKSWTKQYTHISPKISKKFKRVDLKVDAGSAVIFLSQLVHCGYKNKKKNSVRITITERFNPLKKIPFLKKASAPMKIPFTGRNYNAIKN